MKHEQEELRREFLEKYHGEKIWPFVHGYPGVQVDAHWYEIGGWGLDPLVIPALHALNKIDGVETYASCQGTDTSSPYILFNANIKDADRVRKLLGVYLGDFSTEKLLTFIGNGPDEEPSPSWQIIFYDTFSLIKFNRDLGVPVEKQLALPEWTVAIAEKMEVSAEVRNEDMKKFMKPDMPTAKEIESILDLIKVNVFQIL